MVFIGFASKPQRWAFCEDCHAKWMGYSNQTDMGCPRKKIFKVVTGKEPVPPMMRRDDQWLLDLADLPKVD